ncbi:hypothetical protein [Burkholderia sp. Nafp2/4-1b]|uniref:hypothetical protein n=1 Tax=Burkholderia sp. Nafp2/4-1b TaxID=2116686 RepID=UPI00320477C8
MCDGRRRTYSLVGRFHGTIADDCVDLTACRTVNRHRATGLRRGRVVIDRHIAGRHRTANNCRLAGCSHGDTIGLPRIVEPRCIGSGRAHDIGVDIGVDHLPVTARRRRRRRRRNAGTLRHLTASATARSESLERRLPTAVLAIRDRGRRLDVRHRIIARNARRTRSRVEHRIAEQVERAFVPRRIAARRAAGPRGCPGGGVCRGRGGARTRTGR